MAVESPPLAIQLTGATNPAVQFRRAMQGLLPLGTTGGVVGAGDLLVAAQATPNNTVQVAVGGIWIPSSTTAGGAYYGFNPSTYVPTALNAPDPTNPRRDLIVARVRDDGTNADWDIIPVTGTPNATPVDPTPPANSYTLARVSVAAGGGALTITAGMLTDLRTNAHRSIYRARCYQSVQHTILNGDNPQPFDLTDYDPGLALSSNVYHVPITGAYDVKAQIRMTNATATGRFVAQLTVNGAVVTEGNETPVLVGYYPSSIVTDELQLIAGQTVGVSTFWSGTSQLTYVAGKSDSFLAVAFRCPT